MVYIGKSASTTCLTSSLVTAWNNSNLDPTSARKSLNTMATKKNMLSTTLMIIDTVLKLKNSPTTTSPSIPKINISCGPVKVIMAELSGSRFNNSNTADFTYFSPSSLWLSQVISRSDATMI